MEDRVEKIVNEYNQNLLDIDRFVFGTTLSYVFFQDKYKELSKEYEGGKEMELFKDLNSKIPDYESEVFVLAIINLIARAEVFLNDILEILFIWQKKALISDKTISYKEVLESENIEELVEAIRAKEILKFSHSSFKDKLKYLKVKFKLHFPSIEEHMIAIVEIFTTRNIILHNNGLINETYLNINKNSNFVLGSKRPVNKDYVHNTYIYLTILGRSVEKKVKEKIIEANTLEPLVAKNKPETDESELNKNNLTT